MSEQGKSVRIVGASRAQLAADLGARYEQGAAIRTLVDTTGCSYGLVRALLKEAGVTLRARARASASAKPVE